MAIVANRAGSAPIDRPMISPNREGTPAVTFAITPSDTVDLPYDTRLIYVGGAGNITVIDPKGNSRLYTAPAVGNWHRISARRVMSTGTTATVMLGGL